MHRCYIENGRWDGNRIIPSPEEAHHIRHVLRAKDGESVRVFNGAGREAVAVLRAGPGEPLRLEVQDAALAAMDRGMDLVLVQAVLKGTRMDLLIEKATELGVSRIVPVLTQRTIPRLDEAQALQKKARWERIAVSAAKQCGTRWLPVIETPLALEPALQKVIAGGEPLLLASLVENTRPLAAVIDEWRAVPPPSIAVVIGPEGDLTPEETARLLAAGAIPVSLGNLTLRAETAAFFAISALACMLR
jgi:16S rRNA (uracil1498-N3)-methyltransferase